MATRNTVVRSFSLDKSVLAQLVDLAKAQGVSTSHYLNRLLKDTLEMESRAVAAMMNPVVRDGMAKVFTQPAFLRNLVEVMGDEVGSEQMKLFEQFVQGMIEQPKAAPALVKSKAVKRVKR